jgi:hypothetical protein
MCALSSIAMASLLLTLENGGIKAVGDVVSGWQSHKNGFGFFGLGFLDWLVDTRLQVTLQVYARPNRNAHLARAFPSTLKAKHGSQSLYYDLSSPRLEER